MTWSGIYVAGGGAGGAGAALLRDGRARARASSAVCNELTPTPRSGLIDGTLDLVLGTPIAALSKRAVEVMDRAVAQGVNGLTQILLPAELFVSENI